MISRFHYITQDLASITHAEMAERACRGGADWVQFRMKNNDLELIRITAIAVKEICRKYNATFIINDHVLLAKELNADGVHLGRNDMPIDEARAFLGNKFLIGGTANSRADVRNNVSKKVDYIGLGPFRFTVTKEHLSPVLGLKGLQIAIQNVDIPVIAIGGIRSSDVSELISAGLYGVAVSSAINLAPDPVKETEVFLKELKFSKYGIKI